MEELNLKQLLNLVEAIAEEKGLDKERVLSIVEQAIAAAWRRDNVTREHNVRAELDINKGEATAFVVREVVEQVEDEKTQISLEDAKEIDSKVELGGVIEDAHPVGSFGRVAAQTAKQVIMQRLRDAEREIMIEEYKDRVGEIVNGNVQKVDRGTVYVELGSGVGIIPKREQVPNEYYKAGSRIKVLIKEIEEGARGMQLILSRRDKNFVIGLFENEVPEMENGSVEIKAIARDAGVRTKIAVSSTVPGVDPVGTLVGGHGIRIQAVIQEIGEREKIDVINYSESTTEMIYNALSPAEIINVEIDEDKKQARAITTKDQQSIAIGRGGQNVKLASALTGYEIDIVTEDEAKPKPAPKISSKSVEESLISALEEAE